MSAVSARRSCQSLELTRLEDIRYGQFDAILKCGHVSSSPEIPFNVIRMSGLVLKTKSQD